MWIHYCHVQTQIWIEIAMGKNGLRLIINFGRKTVHRRPIIGDRFLQEKIERS
jgi:hypothetical protein